MSLIKIVPPDQAEGPIAEAYQQVEQSIGTVPLPLQMWAASPGIFPMFMSGIGYLMQHPSLSQAMFGWIRYLIARRDVCKFCIDFNQGFLINQLGVTQQQLDAAVADPNSVPLPDRDKALMLLALKAQSTPLAVNAEDIEKVKEFGFSEQEIFDAVAAAALMGMDDMLVNTFKVE